MIRCGASLLLIGTLAPLLAEAETGSDICVGVKIGNESVDPLKCLNARLQAKVTTERKQTAETGSLLGTAVNQAPTADNLYNDTAARERLGDNFGKSPYPERPERSFPSPLTNGR